ncbi:MAG: hypothetical protein JJT95_02415 [Pararhodobacter sp.]|nr:hypothetical protein [Pararhodobacter sp.]
MVFELIGGLSAGLGLLGLVFLLNRLLGGRIPGWVYPFSVAAGLLAFTIWAEYSWADRTLEAQPQLRLADSVSDPSPLRPLSYAVTPVNRMRAIDLSRTRVHPDQPHLVNTLVVSMARWEPIRAVEVTFDCDAPAMAPMGPQVTLHADGTLEGATWLQLEADDRLLRAACTAGEEIRHGRAQGS